MYICGVQKFLFFRVLFLLIGLLSTTLYINAHTKFDKQSQYHSQKIKKIVSNVDDHILGDMVLIEELGEETDDDLSENIHFDFIGNRPHCHFSFLNFSTGNYYFSNLGFPTLKRYILHRNLRI